MRVSATEAPWSRLPIEKPFHVRQLHAPIRKRPDRRRHAAHARAHGRSWRDRLQRLAASLGAALLGAGVYAVIGGLATPPSAA